MFGSMKTILKSLFVTFFKIGCLAWGGPITQLNLIREKAVEEKKWITPDTFKKTLAIYQLLPGPEATEMSVHIGVSKAGKLGGFVAGLAFILPGFVLMLLISFIYKSAGRTALLPLFLFTSPVVTALIVRALHKIAQNHLNLSLKSLFPFVIGLIFSALNCHFFMAFLLCILHELFLLRFNRHIALFISIIIALILLFGNAYDNKHSIEKAPKIISNYEASLFIEGLKGGLLTFGGAYTAIPFLNESMVEKNHLITKDTFFDSLAIMTIIPSPLVMFVTFLGFQINGFVGAILITIGMFLPAFLFSILGFNVLDKLIHTKILHTVLESVSSAVVGVLAYTSYHIFMSSMNSISTAIVFTIALILLYSIKHKALSPALILITAILGVCYSSTV